MFNRIRRLLNASRRRLVASLFLVLLAPAFADDMWSTLFEEQLQEAQAGDADAQYEVGVMYLKGQGTGADRAQALRWLKSAAAQGQQQAKTRLHRMQENEQKFARTRQQAEAGDVEAQYELALMYLKGKGAPLDYARARTWLQKAGSHGYDKATARLGILYFKGEGSDPDYAKALNLLQAAGGKNVLAQYYLGEMYAQGKGVTRDYREAITWYQRAADGGFHKALGKIINLEEEIKMQERRRARLEKEARDKAAVNRVAKSAPVKAETAATAKPKPPAPARVKKSKPAAAPVKTAKQGKASQPAPPPAPLSVLDRLNRQHWLRNERPVDFLPSAVTECEREKSSLVCFSQVLERDNGYQQVHYRVKSTVTQGGSGIQVAYKNLVLDVIDVQQSDPEAEVLAYDDEEEKGFQITTGWTREHKVDCRVQSDDRLDCIKDGAHTLSLRGR